jgi:hypothetical protein
MLLALLMLVAGLLGGALGGLPTLLLEAVRAIDVDSPKLSVDGGLPKAGMGIGIDGGPPDGGGALARPAMGGGVADGGGGVPLEETGAPFGGGGVAFFASVFSAPGFLLTQRLRSGS